MEIKNAAVNDIPSHLRIKKEDELPTLKFTLTSEDKFNELPKEEQDKILAKMKARQLESEAKKAEKQALNSSDQEIKKLKEKKLVKPQGSISKDKNDDSRFRHARERHEGFDIGMYLQPPAMLFTRDRHNIFFGDMYRGCSAFLIAGGPSFGDIDKEKLNQAGALTMGINNSVRSFRPDLWVSVDNPTHFMKSIWYDPKITKFVPMCHTEKKIFDNEHWRMTNTKAGDCPNVFYYLRNEKFMAKRFLTEDSFNWGNHTKWGGQRSVMLVALRLLFYMGVRKVYLLGVDFNMDKETKYHFDQDRSKGSMNNNNKTYKALIERFKELKPYFDTYNFKVYNCNPNSALKVFPYVDFDSAIKEATSDMPADISNERTSGLYDREANEKAAKKKAAKEKEKKQKEAEQKKNAEARKDELKAKALELAKKKQEENNK